MKNIAKMLLPLMAVIMMIASMQAVEVLYTHDLHSNLYPYKIQGEMRGGFAALKAEIDKHPNAMYFDAGDFSMGTLFQTVYASDAVELTMLGELGCIASTLGNHEFDYGTTGLSDMLHAAKASGRTMPQLLMSNVSPGDSKELIQSFEAFGVKENMVFEKDGLKIGVFGLLGKNAKTVTVNFEAKFDDPVESAKKQVKALKAQGAQMIIALSHCGTQEDEKKSEDEILAKQVPEIDLIISGHSHSILYDKIGDTHIVSSGQFGENIGKITLELSPNGRFERMANELIAINDKTGEDKQILSKIDEFKEIVQTKFLDNHGYSFDQVLAVSPFDFETIAQLMQNPGENRIGSLIADGYINAVKDAEGEKYERIDLAVVNSGIIRGALEKGDIKVSDVFNVSSLGMGYRGDIGYPLVIAYLTGSEIKDLCELSASISPLSYDIKINSAGLTYTYNPNRMLLSKVTQASMLDDNGNKVPIQDNKRYRVVASRYAFEMIGYAQSMSKGILKFAPTDKDGNVITDFSKFALKKDGKEVSEWKSLAQYIDSFGGTIPQIYAQDQGRVIIDDNKNFFAIIKSPSKYIVWFGSAILAAIIVIVAIIWFVVFMFKRKRNKLAIKN